MTKMLSFILRKTSSKWIHKQQLVLAGRIQPKKASEDLDYLVNQSKWVPYRNLHCKYKHIL